MKIKTSDLEGAALDWAVALANKNSRVFICEGETCTKEFSEEHGDFFAESYSPSTEWCHGGPLIEKYQVCIEPEAHDGMVGSENSDKWIANIYYNAGDQYTTDPKPTPLRAACEAIVVAEIGEEVEIPEELA